MQYVTSCVLSQSDESCFVSMLQMLDGLRPRIFEAMVFCIQNSECSTQILLLISQQCKTIPGLYLLSDVLYNCNKVDVQYSWSYLPQLESLLPEFILNFKHNSAALALVKIWQSWGVFDSKYLLGLQSLIDEKNLEKNSFLSVYEELLTVSDEYFIKKLCKEFGQCTTGLASEQISRILTFISYLLQTFSISQHWIRINLSTAGENPEIVLQKINQSLDTLLSPNLAGHDLDPKSVKILQKLLQKFSSTYICQHS